MKKMRTKYSPAYKGKVALEALKEEKTSAELANEHQVHPGQIRNWKATVSKRVTELFVGKKKKEEQDKDELIEELYRQVGQLKVELDWLKKKSGINL